MEKVLSVCAYCGTGCGVQIQVDDGRVIGVEPDPSHPVSQGELCIKGYYGFKHLHDPRRLTQPLIRSSTGFSPISWDEALGYIAEKLTAVKSEYGGDAFAMFTSARATDEDNYVAQKFTRAVMGTNNVDHCARL